MNKDKDAILLGWKEVADYLGCSVATAARREADGLPVFRSGGQVRAFEADIDKWLKGLRNNEVFNKLPDLKIESLEEPEDVQGAIATLLNDGSSERVVVLNLGKAKEDYERIELLLKDVEDKYDVLVEEVPEWIWEMNPGGKFVFSNMRITEVLGYLPDEILGRTLYDFLIFADDRPECEETFLNLANDKRVIRGYRCRFTHRDNTIRYIESSCKPIFDSQGLLTGFSGISRDVTDQVYLDNDISRDRLYLKSILEYSTDSIITADEKGKINNWNKIAEKIIGYKEGEVLGRDILSISNISEDPSAYASFLSDINANGGTLLIENLNIMKKDGSEILVSIRYSVIQDTAGNLKGVTAILRETGISKNKVVLSDTTTHIKPTDKKDFI